MKKTHLLTLFAALFLLILTQPLNAAPLLLDGPAQATNDGPVIGFVTALSETSITVNGESFTLAVDSIVGDGVEVGAFVYIWSLDWLGLPEVFTVHVLTDENDEFVTHGVVEAISAESITAGGISFDITAETNIVETPAIGDNVEISARAADFTVTALTITIVPPNGLEYFTFGFITDLTETSVSVDGFVFNITADSVISGEPVIGADVYAYGQFNPVTGQYDLLELAVLGDPPPPVDILYFTGLITAFTGDTVTLEAYGETNTYTIDENTTIYGTIEIGDNAFVRAVEQVDGSLLADSIEVYPSNPEVFYFGVVSAVSADSFELDGYQTLNITEETVIEGLLVVDALVLVNGRTEDDGSVTALDVLSFTMVIEGEVEGMNSNGLLVDGQRLMMDANTVLEGDVAVGTMVEVHAHTPDGSPMPVAGYVKALVPSAVTLASIGSGQASSIFILVTITIAFIGITAYVTSRIEDE